MKLLKIQISPQLQASPTISTLELPTAPVSGPLVNFDETSVYGEFEFDNDEVSVEVLPAIDYVPDRTPVTREDVKRLLSSFTHFLPDGMPAADENSAVLRYHLMLSFGDDSAPIQVKGQHDFAAILLPEMLPEAPDAVSTLLAASVSRPIITRFTAMLAARANSGETTAPMLADRF
jgi:hypothetical protein